MSTPEKTLERILTRREIPSEVELSPIELGVAQAVVGRALRDNVRRQQQVRYWGLGVATLAVAASLVGFLYVPPVPRAHVSDVMAASWGIEGDSVRQVSLGDVLRSGDEVEVAEQGHVDVSFPEGTKVELESTSRLRFESLGKNRRFRLKKGTFSARVVKLKGEEQFVVNTSHASVEVRGTQFQVDVLPATEECSEGATRVRVKEGLVEVRSNQGQQHWVRPGEELNVGCEHPVENTGVVQEAALNTEPSEEDSIEEVSPPVKKKKTSSLARMNRLYEKAMEAKKQKKFGEAVKLLTRFRREFPSGPLDEAAAVEKMRMYEMMGSRRASKDAKEYLEQFPNGYARDVAQDILREAKQ